MKQLILYFLFSIPIIGFSQQIELRGKISKTYNESSTFEVRNDSTSIIVSRLKGNSRLNLIQITNQKDSFRYLLVDNKLLLNMKGDSLASYKRKSIRINELGETITLNSSKNEFTFMQGNEKIGSISYQLDRATNNYQLNLNTHKIDETTLRSISIGLGRFDKAVVMDYDNSSVFEGVLTPVISSLISCF